MQPVDFGRTFQSQSGKLFVASLIDTFNHLINRLGERLNMSSIVVTHDMESAYMIADRIYYLVEGSFYFEGTPDEVRGSSDPLVEKFVKGRSDVKDAVL